MKKYRNIIVSFVCGAVVATAGAAFADQAVTASIMSTIHFKFNGQNQDLPAGYVGLNYGGHVYVPARFVGENMGGTVGWDASSNTVTINTGSSAGQSATAKSFPEDINVTSGPMKMHITKVTLDPAYKKDQYSDAINAVVLQAEVENTSADNVEWDPEQGTVVLNTKEQADAGMSMYYSDQVGGEFDGNVVKKGNIVIQVKSDLSQINDIKLNVRGAFNQKTFDSIGEDTVTDIPVQQ